MRPGDSRIWAGNESQISKPHRFRLTKKDGGSRLRFIGIGAAGASLTTKTMLIDPESLFALPQSVAASQRLRFGMIGIGMQGSNLLSDAIELPGMECVAAFDLCDGRHTLAREITGKADLPVTRRYQELLANKDVDCIVAACQIIGTSRFSMDAVTAGKDIYCEKAMSHSATIRDKSGAAIPRTDVVIKNSAQWINSQPGHQLGGRIPRFRLGTWPVRPYRCGQGISQISSQRRYAACGTDRRHRGHVAGRRHQQRDHGPRSGSRPSEDTSSALRGTITGKEITDLQLNGRKVTQLGPLCPV